MMYQYVQTNDVRFGLRSAMATLFCDSITIILLFNGVIGSEAEELKHTVVAPVHKFGVIHKPVAALHMCYF